MRIATLLLLSAASAPVLRAADGEVAISHWGTHAIVITAPTGADEVNLGARMKQRLTLDWQDSSLGDIADFLRRVTDANIVVDPKLLAADPKITLKASDMELGAVLSWVTRMAPCHMGYVNGAIYLSQEAYQGATKTKLYDVSDLVLPVRNFPGPDLDIPEPGGRGAMILPPVESDKPAPEIDDVESLLRKVVLHQE
jgi:hypothetical protein